MTLKNVYFYFASFERCQFLFGLSELVLFLVIQVIFEFD